MSVDQCPICGKGFNFLFRPRCVCGLCGTAVCGDCLQGVDRHASSICSNCNRIWQTGSRIKEVWPLSYKGKIPAHSDYTRNFGTQWYKDKEAATAELKYWAAKHQLDMLYDVSWSQKKAQAGNYTYTVWQAHGTATGKVD